MKTLGVCMVVLFFAISAFAQLNVGDAWQGTWSDGKRSAGGSTYICVDHWTSTAHGSYSGVGLFSGFLQGNTLTGFWWEAGYDRPFGPFELTISGTSFSGTWSYYEGVGVAPSGSFSWSGSQSSSVLPDRSQCLAPAQGSDASGTYQPGNYICYVPNAPYLNTDQQSAFAAFANFGHVAGYSPDNGITFLLSDFFFPNQTLDERFRPENNQLTSFGPSANYDDDGEINPAMIPTRRIAVGRLVSSDQFCGFFWNGLYNSQVGSAAICLQRTSAKRPDSNTCGADVSFVNGQIDQFITGGLTSFILSQVQDAFNALKLPPVVILAPGQKPPNPSSTPGPNPPGPPPPGISSTPAPNPSGYYVGSSATSFAVPLFTLLALLFVLV